MAAHKSLKRIVYRVLEELRATGEICRYTSIPEAFSTFVAKVEIQRMNRNGFQEPPAVRDCLMKKHAVMLKYFEKKYADFFEQYDCNHDLPTDDPALHDRIWVCWWQGLDNAPDLVKKCIGSVIANAGGHEVTVITEENYKDYVHIPAFVEEKFRKGIISRTHYSDLLRLALLAEHGGLWLDATFLCTQPTLSDYMELPLWSIKRPDYHLHCSIASGYFATYSIACSHEYRWVFATIRDFVLHYWQVNDGIIDYLFLDYLFVFAQRKDPRIAEAFRQIPPNNPRCDDLCVALGATYDEQLWAEMKKETSLFKLTWKQSFAREKNGEMTFYGKILDGGL